MFEAESADVVLDVMLPVERVNVGVWRAGEEAASLVEVAGTGCEVLLCVMLVEVFVGIIIELEYVGMLALVAEGLAEVETVLEAAL